VIKLSGSLTENLGVTVYKQIESTSSQLKGVVFDFNALDSITEEGLDFIRKATYLLKEFGVEVAFSCLKKDWELQFNKKIDKTLAKVFALKDEAIEFIEDKLTKRGETSSSSAVHLEVRSALFKGDTYYTYCPACNVKLRLKSKGNYKCPSCSTKFSFNPIQDSIRYERISLE
jgi:hypothetical protein